jgi:hypothetical protein
VAVKDVTKIIEYLNENPELEARDLLSELNALKPKNALHPDFEKRDEPKSLWFKRRIVTNNTGELRPFTKAFAQVCLQVARNLAPYKTGNLISDMDVEWTPYNIKIVYNKSGRSNYAMFLDDGYPNAKWQGFISYTRSVIATLCAWYQSTNERNLEKLDLAVKALARGGYKMSSFTSLSKDARSVYKLRSAKTTGWEREKQPLYTGRQTRLISASERGFVDKVSNPRIKDIKVIHREYKLREVKQKAKEISRIRGES